MRYNIHHGSHIMVTCHESKMVKCFTLELSQEPLYQSEAYWYSLLLIYYTDSKHGHNIFKNLKIFSNIFVKSGNCMSSAHDICRKIVKYRLAIHQGIKRTYFSISVTICHSSRNLYTPCGRQKCNFVHREYRLLMELLILDKPIENLHSLSER